MSKIRSDNSFIMRLSAFIVDKRTLFFLLFAAALLFSLVSAGWVQVENDITKYLPEDTETRQGIVTMNENFESFATARVMICNVTSQTGQEFADSFSEIDGVAMVTYDTTPEHYKNAAVLIDISFEDGNQDDRTLQAMNSIRQQLTNYDAYIHSDAGTNLNTMLQEEMTVILIVASIIIVIVLILTSRSYAEVPVLLLTFGAAALLNIGTNFLCGKISFISNSIAVVLQLALAIDYAIILCHRFVDAHETHSARDAAVLALSKAIPEIFSSSMTTICGLMALAFMQFSIGYDMSIVLMKSILLSLISVFLLMPGLLVLFCPLMDRTRHKKLIPNVSFLGRFSVITRRIVPPIFLIILIGAAILSQQCPYCYSFNDLKTTKMTESQTAYFKIKENFGTSNMIAVVVPAGDYEAEAAILSQLEGCPEVKSTMGLSGIEALDGYKLTDALTPRQLSELLDMDYELIQMLYAAYASQYSQYGQILNGLDEFRVPLFDIFVYLKDQLQNLNISLDTADGQSISDMFLQLETAQKQLQSDQYSRMVVYLNLPEESEETFTFLDKMHGIIDQYYDEDCYLVGNSTSSRDLSASFITDNTLISILSIVFVMIVLLFTFKSAGLPVLLIVVIQGSIWINFSFPTLMEIPMYFLGYLIVQSIQMGANIDYAIVISSHYQELKKQMPHKEAIVQALNNAFPTVFTSGTIMASAGLLIGNLSTQPVVSIMGTCIGRGTIISVILVLFVLPSILVLGDSIINRTSFKMKSIIPATVKKSGSLRVQGHIHGYISGMIDGDFDGTINGSIEASVTTDGTVRKEGELHAD